MKELFKQPKGLVVSEEQAASAPPPFICKFRRNLTQYLPLLPAKAALTPHGGANRATLQTAIYRCDSLYTMSVQRNKVPGKNAGGILRFLTFKTI